MKCRLFLLGLFAISPLLSTSASGQAFCALRDPVKAIYDLHPSADSYRSIVRSIDDATRTEIAQRLPFTLHFNELGRHTLYVAAKDSKPIGLVHVRSEAGPWGLVEIAWSFTSDMAIDGFIFQRCRSRAKGELLESGFQAKLRGMRRDEVRALVSEDGMALAPGVFTELTTPGRELALIVIRSAMKTIEVTELAWENDLGVLSMLDHAYASFPEGESVELFKEVYSSEAIGEIGKYLDSTGGNGIQRSETTGLRVIGKEGEVVGHVIRTPWSSMGQEIVLWWNITPELVIKDVIPEGDWPDSGMERAFREARGTSFAALDHCQTAAQIVGAEVLILSRSIEGAY